MVQKGWVTDIVRELAKRKDVTSALVIFRDEIEYPTEDIKSLISLIPSSITLSILKPNQYNVSKLQAFVDAFRPDVIHSHLFEADLVSRSINYPPGKILLTLPLEYSCSQQAGADTTIKKRYRSAI